MNFRWLFADQAGISYKKILRYFYPEFVTSLIVYFLPQFIDCYFICNLKSTDLYAISGIVENLLGVFTKCAEGLLIGTVVISGYFNGLHDYKNAGKSFTYGFWATIIIGFCFSLALYLGVMLFYKFNSFSPEMIALGIPYLRVKAIGIFFLFFYFALVGFFRSVKNTFTPMVVFFIGSCVFIVSDYLFIFGKCGLPQFGLLGSAVAYVIQYVLMSCLMLFYLIFSKAYKKYEISFLIRHIEYSRFWSFIKISIPTMIDKTSIAFAYVWLGSCIFKLGTTSAAAFSMIKLMERIAFVPAIAFSQIITFLVSNDLGNRQWVDIYANIKKVVLLASMMVGAILIIGLLWPSLIVHFYKCSPEICSLVEIIFPSLSVLVMFDLLQLILSGALRGAGDVKMVMITRLIVIFCYFIPMTYVINWFSFSTIALKILVTYATFLSGNALMVIIYMIRWNQNDWKNKI
ncbi:MATE family efflux transporter [Candidatus Dependentiae bacterium]|nr:MATE family efflux transporter [Candidatus Dependentiae bacterium]